MRRLGLRVVHTHALLVANRVSVHLVLASTKESTNRFTQRNISRHAMNDWDADILEHEHYKGLGMKPVDVIQKA